MGASTLDRLMNLQQKRKLQNPSLLSEVSEAPSPSVVGASSEVFARDNVHSAAHTTTLHQSLMQEQLESIYADLEHLSKSFPGHNLRSLVDYALELHSKYGEQLAAAAEEKSSSLQNHGIIPAQIFAKLDRLDEDTANATHIAAVELDDAGKVVWISPLAHTMIKAPRSVSGNFFTEVCPGANNSLFFGRFRDGVFRKSMDTSFQYLLAYKTAPTAVDVHLIRESRTGKNFIFFAPIEE